MTETTAQLNAYDAARVLARVVLRRLGSYDAVLGAQDGHPFYGNQWTDSAGRSHEDVLHNQKGEAQTFYHGSTSRDVTATTLDPTRAPVRPRPGQLNGVYFTTNPQTAAGYTRVIGSKQPAGRVISAKLVMKNPLDITKAVKEGQKKGLSFGDAKREALKGVTSQHDGVIFRGDKYNSDEYLVFHPSQIKALGGPGSGNFGHEDEPRSLLRREETIIHQAADKFIPKFSVAVRHAFAMGRRALGHPGFPNADAAANTIKLELLHTLHRTLLATLQAGGDAGIKLMPAMKAAEERALAGPFRMRFDANDPRAIAWAHEHGAELASGISETSRQAIRDAVESALKGEGIQAAWDKILDAVGDEDRADLISRTETMIAANEGQREGWEQAVAQGLLSENVKKQWIATGDSDVCPECEALDGEVVGLDEEYPNDGGDGPPLHPRCRCTEGIVEGK